ncbi:hypothetical protein [Kribbella sp. NPDC004536]|uniref:hypothetical protein n=1 Tax=Kribbella sp. NPDC004536 TaxID=3364106 RepID=UPI0036B6238F
MTTLPPHFVDVLSDRLAEYSGQDVLAIRPGVRSAGGALADRVADLMLDDVRRHVGDADPEYLSARRRLVQAVGPELQTVVSGTGTGVQQLQHARADAERVFALAVDVADPVALAAGAPRAVTAQRAARITVARGQLQGLREDRMPSAEQVGEWLDAVERDPAVLVERVGPALLRAAGDFGYEPRTSTRSDVQTLRDGVARAWVRQRLPDFAAALGRPMEPGDVEQLRYDFQGGIADGLVRSISERTGRSPDELLDRLCQAADPVMLPGDDQWVTARTLLVSAEALTAVDEDLRHRAGWEITWAMQDEFKRHYGNLDRPSELTLEEVGAAIAEAGATTAAGWGVQVTGPRDPGLDAAMNAATVPTTGRPSATAGHGHRSTARAVQSRGPQGSERG